MKKTKISKKKKINTKTFIALAEKVKKYMGDEEKYLKQNENNSSFRFFFNR